MTIVHMHTNLKNRRKDIMELLRMVHGSHLYGLNHEDSDLDTYVVYSGKGKSKQTIIGDDDVIVHSFDSFMTQALKGVPQALEAMFAPREAIIHSEIDYIRDRFVACGSETIDRYCRTIYNMNLGNFKQKVHAFRLAMNLQDLQKYGRFNPRLNKRDRRDLTYLINYPEEVHEFILESVAGVQIFNRKEEA